MRLTFLGTGTSHGVPMIGCQCDVCTSPDPKNHRLRTCLLIQHDGTTVVIDTGPEFRLQALRARLDHLDAVLLTHAHSDHIMGLDDVRAFNMRQGTSMPVYGSPATLGEVRHRFSYAFTDGPEGGGKPKIELCPVDTPFTHGSLRITPLDVRHGREVDIVTAFRVTARDGGPSFAYVTDTNGIPPKAMAELRGLDVLILDALSPNLSPTHFSLTEAVSVAQELAATRTLFTHMSHALEHERTNASLPATFALAYDTQVVELG